jgi:hypothetical protein
MNQLYPIVRRVRRPLLAANAEMPKAETLKAEGVGPVATVVNVEPARVEAPGEDRGLKIEDGENVKSDAKPIAKRNKR